MAMPVALFILVPLAALALSAGLLAFALRGRRVDDHPICRKCGFDLFGKPLGSTVCSECGANLTRPRAGRRGRRERRATLLAVAAPVLMICLAWFALLGWGAARGTNWNGHKPAAWLMREGRSRDVAARDAALIELASRFRKGKLSEERRVELVNLALDIQGDLWRPWTGAVGDVVAAARDAKQLSGEQWERYVRQAAPPQIKVGPDLRRGDRLGLSVFAPTPRLAPGDAQDSDLRCVRLMIGEAEIDLSQAWGETVPVESATARLPDGPYTVRATVQRTVRHTSTARKTATLLDEHVELTAPLTIVPAVVATRKINTNPALREAIQRALTVTQLGVDPGAAPPFPAREPTLSLHVRAVEPPLGMAFRAVLRSAAREWEVGSLRFPPGRTSASVATAALADLPGFDAARVDVVLRPSPEDATGSFHLAELWGGEVVIKDVAVDPPPPRGVPGE
jgi:hypothetical protein